MDEIDETCKICQSDLVFTGYDKDWGVIKCKNDVCNFKIYRSVGNPSDEGFTMESLGYISEYNNEDSED